MPDGQAYTFWGKGVSQGHSDAVRRIDGVKDCRQYTVPVPSALEKAEDGADLAKIENEIKTMPNYFADYDTTVNFITDEEMKRDHSGLPHGGSVIYSGTSSEGQKHVIEYSLKLDSNPEFTGSVLIAYARAAFRLFNEGKSGAMTVLDIAPAYLSAKSGEELRAHCL